MGTTRSLWNPLLLLIVSGYLTCVYNFATDEMKIMKRPTIFISHVKYIRRWWILRCNSGIKVPLHTWAGNTDVCFGTLNVESSYHAPYQTGSQRARHFRSPNDPVEKKVLTVDTSQRSTTHKSRLVLLPEYYFNWLTYSWKRKIKQILAIKNRPFQNSGVQPGIPNWTKFD